MIYFTDTGITFTFQTPTFLRIKLRRISIEKKWQNHQKHKHDDNINIPRMNAAGSVFAQR